MDKKVKAGVAAAVVAAGVGVNQVFSPQDLTESADQGPAPAEIVEPAQTQAADAAFAAYTEQRRMGWADRLRQRILALPGAVKAAVLLPLWAVGAIPAALVTALSPFWRALLGLGLQALVLAAVFALAVKLLFPGTKLRRLFRRKNWKWLFLGAFTLTAADLLLGQLWDGWPALRVVLLLAAGYGVLWLLWKRLCAGLRGPEKPRVRTELKVEY